MHRAQVLLSLVALCLIADVRADVPVQFTGGNGTPLTITFPAPITFVVNNATGANGTIFQFLNTGNLFGGEDLDFNNGPTYSINGGSPLALTDAISSNTPTSNDLLLFRQFDANHTLANGDVITLNAGTISIPGNYAPAPPPSGLYPAFMIDGNLAHIAVGTAPEPASLSLLGLAGLALVRRCAGLSSR
jgi:hypothetical protein